MLGVATLCAVPGSALTTAAAPIGIESRAAFTRVSRLVRATGLRVIRSDAQGTGSASRARAVSCGVSPQFPLS